MTDQEIREAIEFYNDDRIPGDTNPEKLITYHEECDKHFNVLLSLASQYLKVEGLPEKKDCGVSVEFAEGGGEINPEEDINYQGYVRGFNEAIDLCRLAIAKYYIRKDIQ